jgi:hypothetical protein
MTNCRRDRDNLGKQNVCTKGRNIKETMFVRRMHIFISVFQITDARHKLKLSTGCLARYAQQPCM